MNDVNNQALPITLSDTPEQAAANLAEFKRLLAAFDGGALETPVGDAVHAAFTSQTTDALDTIIGICDRDRNLPGGAVSVALQNSISAATELCKKEMRFKKLNAKGVAYLCEEVTKKGVKAPRWMHNLRGEFDKLYAVRSARSNKPKATYQDKMDALVAKGIKDGIGEAGVRAIFEAALLKATGNVPVEKAA